MNHFSSSGCTAGELTFNTVAIFHQVMGTLKGRICKLLASVAVRRRLWFSALLATRNFRTNFVQSTKRESLAYVSMCCCLPN